MFVLYTFFINGLILLLKIDSHVIGVIAVASKYYFKLFPLPRLDRVSAKEDYHFILVFEYTIIICLFFMCIYYLLKIIQKF